MSDHQSLYSYSATHSDDTIYSSAATASSGSLGTNASADTAFRPQSQKHRLGGTSNTMASGTAAGGPRGRGSQQSQAPPASGDGPVRDAGGGGSAVPRARQRSQHRRSVSLLSRLRHTGAASPTGSPTSSESSSRDTRSDRTLAHSASSGSMRNQPAEKEHHRPTVRVLPPHDDAGPSVRKRLSHRGDRPGFISQLLRGQQRSSRSPHQSAPLQAETQGPRHFARSPGTPRSHRSAGSPSPASAGVVEEDDVAHQVAPQHYHVSHCRFGQPVASHGVAHAGEVASGPEHHQQDGYSVCGGADGAFYVSNGPSVPGHLVGASIDQETDDGGPDDMVDPYGHSGWYSDSDMHTAGRLVSSLPVYKPIDMGRFQTQHTGYVRATRPVLPDARMLAPMASLADVCGSGAMGEYGALSNRELRFAVENHMLVEQHRYLIRDLGHARSAISALKQVVQAKEERYEHFEMVNMELQQRVALLESILTPEQRHQLACLPYAFISPASNHSRDPAADALQYAQQQESGDNDPYFDAQQGPADDSQSIGDNISISDDELGDLRPCPPVPLSLKSNTQSGTEQQQSSDRKHVTRPLSGYATGYSFNDKPVHQLPRVFSGDFSSTDVQAMETSVEALANAITAMPRNVDSVEDIIASKASASDDSQVSQPQSCDSCSDHEADTAKHGGRKRYGKDDNPTSPAGLKRRSRFFQALRLPGRTSSTASSSLVSAVGQSGSSAENHKRRSVSLGIGGNPRDQQLSAPPEACASAGNLPVRDVWDPKRTSSYGSLVASCPMLNSGVAKPQAGQQQSQRHPSGGRYPMGLGLSDSEASGTSRPPSVNTGHQAVHGSLESMGLRSSAGRKVSATKRHSLTAQPRRSTSAPSRPHSMRVSGRRSWIFQLFSSSKRAPDDGGSNSYDESQQVDSADEMSDEFSGVKSRRRRVMTHSSDEISRFLGKLRLEEPPHSVGGVLEDVMDVSGEDEERANRISLSVNEIRQQTLDALNGTHRGKRSVSIDRRDARSPHGALKSPLHGSNRETHLDVADDSSAELDYDGSRRRQRDAGASTVRRQSTSSPASTSCTLGLSVGNGAPRQGRDQQGDTADAPSRDSTGIDMFGRGRRSQSWAQGADSARPPLSMSAADDADNGHGSNRWAPALWAPQSLSVASVTSPAANTWSPRNSSDSVDGNTASLRRTSDEARFLSPRGSIALGKGNRASGSGGRDSPWEMVKLSDSRNYSISPNHSRTGSSPPPLPRTLGYFEDTVVPDSDELTMAARRSLSIRMSHTSFKQAEPLPETEDATSVDYERERAATMFVNTEDRNQSGLADGHGLLVSPRNPALARVAITAQPKRRSLLRQLNPKSAKAQGSVFGEPVLTESGVVAPGGGVQTSGIPAASSDTHSVSADVQSAPSSVRRPKKWWMSVLG